MDKMEMNEANCLIEKDIFIFHLAAFSKNINRSTINRLP